jgi:hypothetical protein
MPNGYIIAEGAFLGTFSYASQPADSWGWPSRAYFCRFCGDIWARAVLTDKASNPYPFRIAEVGCRSHPEPWGIPGSLLCGEIAYNLNELSRECIAREFDVHLAYYENLIKEST